LVEELVVTPGNVHDGRAGGDALPDNPGLVYAHIHVTPPVTHGKMAESTRPEPMPSSMGIRVRTE
jgi:hypothetical protein